MCTVTHRRRVWIVAVLSLGLSAVMLAWLLPAGHGAVPPGFAAPRPLEALTLTANERDEALRRAKVWRSVDRQPADFSTNPPYPSGLLSEPIVQCQYLPR